MMHKRFTKYTALIALMFSLAAAGCRGNGKDKAASSAPPAYEVLELQAADVTMHTDYPATLQGEEVIDIRPRVEGYLEELYVDEGATVSKGQRLFRISNPQFEQELRSAQAGIHTAQANADAAEMMVRKTKPLVDKEIISGYDLEAAEYAALAAQATLTQSKATLANAQANLNFTTVTSPADGVIGIIPFRKGSLVSSTSTLPLTTLAAATDIFAYFSLNEKQLLQLNRTLPGRTMQEKLLKLPPVLLVLADGTTYAQQGRISTASGLIATATGSVNLRATFPNPDGLLHSGASALLRLPNTVQQGILLPQSATFEMQDKRLVYIVDKENRVFSRAIQTVPTDDGQAFLVEKGLQAGDRIVLTGLASLKDSLTISPKIVSPKDLPLLPTDNNRTAR